MKMKTETKANIRQCRTHSAAAPLWIAAFLLIGMLGFSQHAAADISEGFESGLPTSYSTGTYTLGSGDWYVVNVIRGTTRYAGKYACQIRSSTGAQAQSPTVAGGVGTISFWVRSSTSSGAMQVNISENGGTSWSAASGSPFTGIGTTFTYYEITVNNSSVNKVQFYRTGATIYLDEVSITSYGGATAPEIAVLGTNRAEIASGDHTPAASDGTDFGSVANGTAVTNTFTITNLTTATANLILTATPSIALNGSNAFTVVTQPASTSIAAGATTTFKVKFAPAEYSTTYTSMVTVANNDSDEGTYVFKIQGTSPAAPAPEMAILGTNLAVIADGDSTPATADGTDFGSISTAVAVTNTFTITNSGSANLTLSNPTITGHVAFTVAANPSTPVSAGGSTTFKIKFAPTEPGMTYTAVVSVANNDSDENPYNFSISGTAPCFTDVTGIYVNPTNETNFTINWSAVSGADGYVVDVSTEEDFGGGGGGSTNNIFISEMCDPQNNYTSDRYIEIFNAGSASVDLTGWSVVAVGNSSDIHTWTLSGTIGSSNALTCGDSSNTQFTPDFSDSSWSSDNTSWNGKVGDGARLVRSGTTIDNTETTANAFENKTYVRNAGIGTGVTTYASGEWSATAVSDAGSGASTPGSHDCTSVPSGGSGGGGLNCIPGYTNRWDDASPLVVTGLSSGVTYYYRVTATNANCSVTSDTGDVTTTSAATSPEIAVLGTNLAEIASGDHTPAASDGTDFGSVANGAAVTNTFTITNLTTATANLILTADPSISISGSNAFTVLTQPASTSIAAGATTTFQIKFAPTLDSTSYTGLVTIANNDSDEGTYVFKIQGSSPAGVGCGTYWHALYNRGTPVQTYYLGDSLAYVFYFAVNTDTTAWDIDYGVGTSTDGSGWTWNSAAWHQQDGNNREWKSVADEVQFTATGNYYYGGRMVTNGCSYYADVDWESTDGTAGLSAASYFTVSPLQGPSGVSAAQDGTHAATRADLGWTQWNSKNVMITYATAVPSGSPSQGTAYSYNDTFGNQTVYAGSQSGTSLEVTNLTPGATYYFSFYSENFSYYSTGNVASSLTMEIPNYRNTSGSATPGVPAGTIYLGDTAKVFTFESWGTVEAAWGQGRLWLRQGNADLTAGTAGTWAGFVNTDGKSVTSGLFNATGTWYWGIQMDYGAQFGTDFWYKASSASWTDMAVNGTAAGLSFTVSAIVNPSGQTATAGAGDPYSEIDLDWVKNAAGNNVMVVRKLSTDSWTEPSQGTPYAVSAALGDGEVIYNGSGTSFTDSGLTIDTTYDFKFYSVNNNYYSPGVTNFAATDSCFTDVTGVYVNPTNATDFTLNWTAISGVDGYLVDVSTNNIFGGGGGNLMSNPGFETGDNTDWDTFESGYSVVSEDSYEGTYAVKCVAGSTRDLMQQVAITGDGVTEYEISYYYKVTDGDDSDVRIWASWSTGGQESGDNLMPGSYNATEADWTKISYTVVPSSGNNVLNFEIRTYKGATVYMDNFFVGEDGAGGGGAIAGYLSRPVSGTSVSVTGLTEGVAYYYRVTATNEDCSATSSTGSVTTVVSADIYGPLFSNFAVTNSTGTTVLDSHFSGFPLFVNINDSTTGVRWTTATQPYFTVTNPSGSEVVGATTFTTTGHADRETSCTATGAVPNIASSFVAGTWKVSVWAEDMNDYAGTNYYTFTAADDDPVVPIAFSMHLSSTDEGADTVGSGALLAGTGWWLTGQVKDVTSGVDTNSFPPYFLLYDFNGDLQYSNQMVCLFDDGAATIQGSVQQSALSALGSADAGVWTAKVFVTDNDADGWVGDSLTITSEVVFTVVYSCPGGPASLYANPTNVFDFTANWSGVSGVSDYIINVYSNYASSTELFFSEYIEGSGNNKYLEIYNGTGGDVDLSDYVIHQFNGGSATPSFTMYLSGTLADGDVYVIANSLASAWGGTPDLVTNSAVMAFNGDDGLALSNTALNTYCDIIGLIGTDPGTEWGSGFTSTEDNTIRRKSTITTGDTDGTDAFDPVTEWDGYAVDTVSGLGSHTVSGGSGSTEYVPGFSNLLVSSSTSQSVTGLVPNTPYYFEVASIGAACTGTFSAVETIYTRPVWDLSAASATADGNTLIDLAWTKHASYDVMIVARLGSASTAPDQGTAYSVGGSCGSGTVIYKGAGSTLDHVVPSDTTHHYAFYSYSGNYYSTGITASASTGAFLPGEFVETFSYTNSTALTGLNGSNLWAGAWYGDTAQFTNASGSFSEQVAYPTPTGNKLLTTPATDAEVKVYRPLNQEYKSGRMYFGYIMNYGQAGVNQYAGLSLMYSNSAEKLFIGEIGTADQTLGIDSTSSSYTLTAGAGKDYIIVGYYDWGAGEAKVKAYEIGSQSVPSEEPLVWDATVSKASNTVGIINNIRLAAGEVGGAEHWSPGSCYFDEIRISTNWFDLVQTSPSRIIYDGFGGTDPNSLSGWSGGTGWSDTWALGGAAFVNFSNPSFDDGYSSYHIPTGEKIVMYGDEDGRYVTATRTFNQTFTAGQVYFSWMQNYEFNGSGKWAGIKILDSGTEKAFIGKISGADKALGIDDSTHNVTSSVVNLENGAGNNYIIVAKYDFGTRELAATSYKVTSDVNCEMVAEEPNGFWQLTTTQSVGYISSLSGVRLHIGAGPTVQIGDVYMDEVRVGTNWYEVTRQDGETNAAVMTAGPKPTLVYVGTNSFANVKDSLTGANSDITVTDADLVDEGSPLTIAARWEDSNGVFLTNANETLNIGSRPGRVNPNWDPAVLDAPGFSAIGYDASFTNFYGYNGALSVTSYVDFAFNITNDFSTATSVYYMTVSAEDDNQTGGAITAPNGADAVPVWRALTINSNMLFYVADDDTTGPVVSDFVVGGSGAAGGCSVSALSPGDIFITGFNADTNHPVDDDFSFVTFTDIDPGVTIYITDRGWSNNISFWSTENEGIITYTTPVDGLFAGDRIVISNPTTIPTVTTGSVSSTTAPASFNFSGSGDQLIIYQTAPGSTSFIFALSTDSTTWSNNASASNFSDVPPGLIPGVSAMHANEDLGMAADVDCGSYTGILSGTTAAIKAAIFNEVNWISTDSGPYTLSGAAFTVTDACVGGGQVTDGQIFNGGYGVTATVADAVSGVMVSNLMVNYYLLWNEDGNMACSNSFLTPYTNASLGPVTMITTGSPAYSSAVVTLGTYSGVVVVADADNDRDGDYMMQTSTVSFTVIDDDTNGPAASGFQIEDSEAEWDSRGDLVLTGIVTDVSGVDTGSMYFLMYDEDSALIWSNNFAVSGSENDDYYVSSTSSGPSVDDMCGGIYTIDVVAVDGDLDRGSEDTMVTTNLNALIVSVIGEGGAPAEVTNLTVNNTPIVDDSTLTLTDGDINTGGYNLSMILTHEDGLYIDGGTPSFSMYNDNGTEIMNDEPFTSIVDVVEGAYTVYYATNLALPGVLAANVDLGQYSVTWSASNQGACIAVEVDSGLITGGTNVFTVEDDDTTAPVLSAFSVDDQPAGIVTVSVAAAFSITGLVQDADSGISIDTDAPTYSIYDLAGGWLTGYEDQTFTTQPAHGGGSATAAALGASVSLPPSGCGVAYTVVVTVADADADRASDGETTADEQVLILMVEGQGADLTGDGLYVNDTAVSDANAAIVYDNEFAAGTWTMNFAVANADVLIVGDESPSYKVYDPSDGYVYGDHWDSFAQDATTTYGTNAPMDLPPTTNFVLGQYEVYWSGRTEGALCYGAATESGDFGAAYTNIINVADDDPVYPVIIDNFSVAGGSVTGGVGNLGCDDTRTNLVAGDIAIIGMNTYTKGSPFNNQDSFAFVATVGIPAGTEIKFTDNGWHCGALYGNEGTITWISTNCVEPGTVIIYEKYSDPYDSASSATVNIGQLVNDAMFSLNIRNEEILAYQGDDSDPTFLYALDTSITVPGVWENCPLPTSDMATRTSLPPGLQNGLTAVCVNNYDDVVLDTNTISILGDRQSVLEYIGDYNNWIGHDDTVYPLDTWDFTFPELGSVGGTVTDEDILNGTWDITGQVYDVDSGLSQDSVWYVAFNTSGVAFISGGSFTNAWNPPTATQNLNISTVEAANSYENVTIGTNNYVTIAAMDIDADRGSDALTEYLNVYFTVVDDDINPPFFDYLTWNGGTSLDTNQAIAGDISVTARVNDIESGIAFETAPPYILVLDTDGNVAASNVFNVGSLVDGDARDSYTTVTTLLPLDELGCGTYTAHVIIVDADIDRLDDRLMTTNSILLDMAGNSVPVTNQYITAAGVELEVLAGEVTDGMINTGGWDMAVLLSHPFSQILLDAPDDPQYQVHSAATNWLWSGSWTNGTSVSTNFYATNTVQELDPSNYDLIDTGIYQVVWWAVSEDVCDPGMMGTNQMLVVDDDIVPPEWTDPEVFMTNNGVEYSGNWTNVNDFTIVWSAASDADTGFEYRRVLNTDPTTNTVMGVSLGTNNTLHITDAALGQTTNWIYAVDVDDDRPHDRLKAVNTNFVTRFDNVAPEALYFDSADKGPDASSEIALSWTALESAGGQDSYTNPLSPWASYRIFYEIGADPSTNSPYYDVAEYANLGDIDTASVILSNLAFGTEYHLDIAGVDEAGNVGELQLPSTVTLLAFNMTQAVTRVNTTSLVNAAHLSWTATNAMGIIPRAVDLIYVDAASFTAVLSNQWEHATTITNNSWVMEDSLNIPAGKTRFYRAAIGNSWMTNRTPRSASKEVWGVRPVTLYPGQNWVSLFGHPMNNTVIDLIGTNLPAGSAATSPDATKISWYARSALSVPPWWVATQQVALVNDGGNYNWAVTEGGALNGNEVALPLHEAFVIEIPSNSSPQTIYLVGQVPTTTLTQTIHSALSSTAAGRNLISLNLPKAMHPSEMGLLSSGFKGGIAPPFSDQLWKYDRVNQKAPYGVWYRTSDSTWRMTYPIPFPLVPTNYFSPDDGIYIWVKNSTNSNWNLTQPLPYTEPSIRMNP